MTPLKKCCKSDRLFTEGDFQKAGQDFSCPAFLRNVNFWLYPIDFANDVRQKRDETVSALLPKYPDIFKEMAGKLVSLYFFDWKTLDKTDLKLFPIGVQVCFSVASGRKKGYYGSKFISFCRIGVVNMLIADLHIHSKYSRATSRDGIPEFLELWARKKGIDLIGTGDFTHPAWRQELSEKLIPDGNGLYRLREDLIKRDSVTPDNRQPRFVLSGEISSIYKKNGKTRKVHNVILLPSLEAAENLSHKLEAIGNIHSDGRPILGLDSRDLLEITLDACPDAIFIPAHIWTPHFSLFGAFSGFDTIEECFEDLTPHIHALETGLSSDPPMNWRLSALDRYQLISNSDAHSPAKLGREANLLEMELSYPALAHALETGEGLFGTIEFFPEEGKYHCDGHRNCGLCLSPAESEQYGGLCPVCGKKLTIGVEHRVEQLADREPGFRPASGKPFESLAPLPEVIAASTGESVSGVRVHTRYETMIKELGSEFYILRQAPLEDIHRVAGPCVTEGIRRLREGRVERIPGFDGEYGKIQLLTPTEIDELNGQISLFSGISSEPKKKSIPRVKAKASVSAKTADSKPSASGLLDGLNPQQLQAVTSESKAIAVIAGPGTGKTRTLVSRIADLIERRKVSSAEIAAVTFTNKSAAEMRERLERHFDGKRLLHPMTIGTFHAICLSLLEKTYGSVNLLGEYEALEVAAEILKELGIKRSSRRFLQEVSRRKNGLKPIADEFSEEAFANYEKKLEQMDVLDFDDLLNKALELEENSSTSAGRFPYLLVDEFQDINPIQYRLLQAWNRNGKGIFAIGDPDQAIYGFRGSDAGCFEALTSDFPGLEKIRLVQNYRSTPEIINCAMALIEQNGGPQHRLEATLPPGADVRLWTLESDLSEGIFAAKEINRMVGGIDMLDSDRQTTRFESGKARSFSDIALLYRTHRQADMLEKCLRKEGIPYVVIGRDDFLSNETVRGVLAFLQFLLYPAETHSLKTALRLLWNCPADLTEGYSSFWNDWQGEKLCPEDIRLFSKEYQGVGILQEFLLLAEKFAASVQKEKPRKLLEKLLEKAKIPVSDSLERLLNTAVFYSSTPEFLHNLLLGSEGDLARSGVKSYTSGMVTLMSLHASKGLEFPIVFICGASKGLIPLESSSHPADLPEERRLFYVGMTRARQELYLLSSAKPSPFLDDIPDSLLKTGTIAGRKKASEGKQLSLFD